MRVRIPSRSPKYEVSVMLSTTNTIRGSKANDPDTGLGIEKQYSADALRRIVSNRKKVKLSINTNNGSHISGSIYIPSDVRPSDFLRSPEVKRILLVDASINGVEKLSPVLVMVDNCEYIGLVGDFESIE